MYTTRDILQTVYTTTNIILLHTATFYLYLCEQFFLSYLLVLLLGQVQVKSGSCWSRSFYRHPATSVKVLKSKIFNSVYHSVKYNYRLLGKAQIIDWGQGEGCTSSFLPLSLSLSPERVKKT